MAPANATSSPRDHAADSNPELARKKQRLGEEPESPSEGSVVIEVLDPEDIGGNAENAIEIEDDISSSMDVEPYSDGFCIFSDSLLSPFEQLERLRADATENNLYIEHKTFIRFSNALNNHLAKTIGDRAAWKRHYLEDEADFFTKVALAGIALLDTGDLFDPSHNINNGAIREAFTTLLNSLAQLSWRIIPFLPEAIKSTLTRRDSAQPSTRQQHVGALYYVVVAYKTIAFDTTSTASYFKRHDPQLRLDPTVDFNVRRLCDEEMVCWLATLVRTLSGAMREVKDSWICLGSALHLVKVPLVRQQDAPAYPEEQFEEVMGVISACTLPAICEKHPRALPGDFHDSIVSIGSQALQAHALVHDVASAVHLYESFIKSTTDALLPEPGEGEATEAALWRICGEDKETLSRLLGTAWSLKTAKAYVFSDIMDIRHVGVSSLKHQLLEIFRSERESPVGFEHPVIQYAVRFLRQNEITGYILGPQSRAGLLNQSSDIVCFLAATSSYTDAETDIIWRACSGSVEADFVKASFGVLGNLMQHLDFGHLLYLAKKYSITPQDKLGVDAVAFLPRLLRELETKCASLAQQNGHLVSVSFACLEILKHANTFRPDSAKDYLCQISMAHIAHLATPDVHFEDRKQLYACVIPEIQGHTQHATTGVTVMNILISVRLSSEEAEFILAMLPVHAAVDEFCDYVSTQHSHGTGQSNVTNAIVRLNYITRLMALGGERSDNNTNDRLFSFAFGESALSTEARSAAWESLYAMANASNLPSAATSMWKSYMQDYVPTLAVHLATPKVVEFIIASLKADYARETEISKLLKHPLWQTLMRFATTGTNIATVNAAAGALLDMLFVFPTLVASPSSDVTQFITQFTRNHITGLCSEHTEPDNFEDPAQIRKFYFQINLLVQTLIKSRESTFTHDLVEQADDLVLVDVDNAVEVLSFTAQVYGPEPQPIPVTVKASSKTKISDLLSKLPDITGTAVNRVVVGGSEVSDVPEQTIAEAGIRQSGSVMIRPRYTIDVNLDQVLTCTDPVEREILAQYESLESFLDGPESIARRMYSCLIAVRLSAAVRSKACSVTAGASDLFPHDRPWRTLFSLFLLQRHLEDFARLGVVDKRFALHSVRLLTTYVLDDARPFDLSLLSEALNALVAFLRGEYAVLHPRVVTLTGNVERPQTEGDSLYFEDERGFVSRMIELLFKVTELPMDPALTATSLPSRALLAVKAYEALLLACKTSDSLWSAFTQDVNSAELHKRLLLDDDTGLSSQIAPLIKSFCQDAKDTGSVAHIYWEIATASLPDALSKGPVSDIYFCIVVDILHMDEPLRTNEDRVRNLIESLTSRLWSYRHTESLSLLIPDKAIAGLLRLLGVATGILKSFKKPLALNGLAVRLFQEFLYPHPSEMRSYPLIEEDTRALVYDLVRRCFEHSDDYEAIVNLVRHATRRSTKDVGAIYPGRPYWIRPFSIAAGLKNLGMTCYMNSLLQQLCGNLQFRQFIIRQPVLDQRQQAILFQLQMLFAKMQNGVNPVADTTALAQLLDIQIGIQEDVHTFYTTLLSRLEDNMPGPESRLALTDFFTGKSVTQVKGNCGHISTRIESFTELSITVKNKASLHDSLGEFVQGEPLEGANRYKCMTCAADEGGRLVDAVRRTCLENVPDNLTFCLKRFTYESMVDGENKVNDRFEFPREIDMSVYKRKHLEDVEAVREPDVFELVGVIVHQGSLHYGHYWSYVRVPGAHDPQKSTWLYLEDQKSNICAGGVQEVQEQCFGGQRWSTGSERPDNAYVLFYQRKSYASEVDLNNASGSLYHLSHHLLPRVNLTDELQSEVDRDNIWRWYIGTLFSSQFHSFVAWLLNQYRYVTDARHASFDESPVTTSADLPTAASDSEIEEDIAELIFTYALRILLPEPSADTRVDSFMTSLTSVLETSPSLAGSILRRVTQDTFAFETIVQNKSSKVRSRFFAAIENCMACLQEQEPEKYASVLESVIANHASLLAHCLDYARGQWNEYFAFAARLAGQGDFETGLVLENDYLDWILDVLYIFYDQGSRKRHPALWNWVRINLPDFAPLFDFLFTLLNEHVDLMEAPLRSSWEQQHSHAPRGWCLHEQEIHALLKQKKIDGHPPWLLLRAASEHCAERSDWKEYAPGKLIGLLVSDRVHPSIYGAVENLMLQHYEQEQRHATPLMLITLHYCMHRSDEEECKVMLKTLSKNLILWDKIDKDCIRFFEETYKLSPLAVLDSVPIWAEQYLRKQLAGQQTLEWLRDHLLGQTTLTGDASLDACRIRSTRTLIGQCREVLIAAYESEAGRERFESMIQAMKHTEEYLEDMRADRQSQDNITLSPELVIELDEASSALAAVTDLLSTLSDWEYETTLPTRIHDVGTPIELDSDDEETSDADVEDFSSNGR